jgi:hypothetical protein
MFAIAVRNLKTGREAGMRLVIKNSLALLIAHYPCIV